MKTLTLGILIGGLALIISCQESETVTAEFTGNEALYSLQQGSDYKVSGTVLFKEKTDGSAFVDITLSGTEDGLEHPVHLHLGNISSPDAEVAALLTSITGKTGSSETNLIRLADESPITYRQLIDLDACIKVHLASSGPDRDIILAGGNIGQAALKDVSGGRVGFGVCKSE